MCPCDSYQCLTIDAQSCAGAVELPLVATVTGTHTIRVAFTGMWLSRTFDATSGQPFIVPNLFNFLYQHQMRIELPDGSLFNDTCYNVSAMATTWIDPLPLPPTSGTGLIIYAKVGDPDEELPQYDYIFANGATITIPETANKRVILFRDGNLVLENASGYSRTGSDYSTFNIVGGSSDETLTFVIQQALYVPPSGGGFSSGFSEGFS